MKKNMYKLGIFLTLALFSIIAVVQIQGATSRKNRVLSSILPGAEKLLPDRMLIPISSMSASVDTLLKSVIATKTVGTGVDSFLTITSAYSAAYIKGLSTYPISYPIPYKSKVKSIKVRTRSISGDSLAIALYAVNPVNLGLFLDTTGTAYYRQYGADSLSSNLCGGDTLFYPSTLCIGDTTYVDSLVTTISVGNKDTIGAGEMIFIGCYCGVDSAFTSPTGFREKILEPLQGWVEIEILE